MPNSLYAPPALIGLYRAVQKRMTVHTDGLGPAAFIAAAKNGYHDSRAGNPGSDYSVQCPADRDGDRHAAAAVDISLGPSDMRLVTDRLFDACRRNDPRIEYVREVIGTLDGQNVDVYNRVATGNGSRSRTGSIGAASDRSHMWHVHISILRRYTNDEQKMLGIAEVVCGLRPGTLTKDKPATPAKPSKPKPPAGPQGQKTYVMYVTKDGTKGYAKPPAVGKVKHIRKRGYKLRGYPVRRSDGRYLRTLWGTDYPMDALSHRKPKK